MKAFVITIIGLPLSERGASRCIEAAKAYDLVVELFPATTRYEAEAVMSAEGLTVNKRIYDRISDEPIGDRAMIEKGRWHLTTPEVGCFLSHFHLWKQCLELREPVIVFEHDACLIAPPPPLIPTILVLFFHQSILGGTAGYIISPDGARIMIDEARENGIQPLDDMLRCEALTPRQRAYCEPPVIAYDDHGVSTIQYTRSDHTHDKTQKSDPWDDYVPPHSPEAHRDCD